ncbi:unnamed protein product [Paramecium octaurelia]|uniref:Uncharacterized protein n=1 Tax=Paramecium octaurelia TaxID=43137 RepID=A0A8S1WDM8_PAROT|nr:unnamed protein product [Paramecium octaurelia]
MKSQYIIPISSILEFNTASLFSQANHSHEVRTQNASYYFSNQNPRQNTFQILEDDTKRELSNIMTKILCLDQSV